jgi:voltage-gated potassium channel
MSEDPRVQNVRSLVARPGFQLTIVGLILAWTGLTVTEISVGEESDAGRWLRWTSMALGALFAAELGLRWFAAGSTRRFLRDHWVDLLAVASVLPGLAVTFPATRLLRLLRVLRVIAIVRRLPTIAGLAKRKTARRSLALAAVVALSAIIATAALLAFESEKNPELSTFPQAFWFSLYSIFATQPTPDVPLTLGGRIVSLILIFVGLSTFAVFTGTVTAVVTQRLRLEGATVEWEDLEGHIIICGWNRKAELIVREAFAARPDDPMPIVVIAKLEGGTPFIADAAVRAHVQFLNDDFTKVSALEKAGVKRASTVILLSDTEKGRNERDADARTILAALTVEKLNPNAYTCAEINRREYAQHLKLGKVDDYVVSGEHSAFLLAAAALNRGVMNVFNELLSYEYGNKFCRTAVREEWIGKSFLDVFITFKKDKNVILIAVMDKKGKTKINPSDYILKEGDVLVAIASHDFEFDV